MLFSQSQNGVADCKGASVHGARGPRHVGGKSLLRLYSGLFGTSEGAEHALRSRGGESSSRRNRAEHPLEEP